MTGWLSFQWGGRLARQAAERRSCALHPNCPTPMICLQRRPAPERITEDVVALLSIFDVIANDAVKVLVLPDNTNALAIPADALGRERFPGMQDIFHREIGMGFENDMHMVVHHDIGMERVTSAVEMAKA